MLIISIFASEIRINGSMLKEVYKISAIVLAIMLVVTTGGFSIYEHFCGCSEVVETSLLVENFDCSDHHQDAAEISCHTEKDTPAEKCCSHPVEKSARSCQAGDCCSTSGVFVRLQHIFNLPLEKISLKFVIAFVRLISSEELSYHDNHTFVKENYLYNNLPPPLFGKEMILAYHQAKIPPPSA